MKIVLCDTCGDRIQGGVFKFSTGEQDFCFSCFETAKEPVCAHEDNISDQVPGRVTARLVCKECGYDRIEEVA